ncbi:unnamed protein product [Clavelina lepadiformis]|uniref:CUB domain-containing protein n=1 Tax=Clavelina lepadiformis TaxID=159417 RepID=A0ABP0FQT9_CLALP
MLRFLFTIVVYICLLQTSAANEDVFVVGLFENAVYEKATDISLSNSVENGKRSLRASIVNLADVTQMIGFHGYLPDQADVISFAVVSGGITYPAKKSNWEVGERTLKEARFKNHNAVVFYRQSLPDAVGKLQQSSEKNVNIKPGHRLDFHLVYNDNHMNATSCSATNKAHVVLDFYATSAVSLIGEIASPNYPIAKPDNGHITWLIRVPDGFVVELEIVDLVIEECCNQLTIFDGISPFNVTIADITSNVFNLSLKFFHSSGNNMFLRFTSDCSEVLGGFSAVTRALLENTFNNTSASTNVNVTSSVSHNLNATFEENFLTSPSYSDQHSNDIDYYSWTIKAVNASYVIRLRVIDMDLESCCDRIFVHDGPTGDSPLLVTLSGKDNDVTMLSNSDSVYITFISEKSTRNMSFQIAYSSVLSVGSDPTTTLYSTTTTTSKMTYTESSAARTKYLRIPSTSAIVFWKIPLLLLILFFL